MAEFDLILFDVDGTLVDSQHTIVACMEQAFARCHLPPPSPAAIRSSIGLSLIDGIAQLLTGIPGAKDADPLRAVQAYREIFAARRTAIPAFAPDPLYPGTKALLDRLLAAGQPFGVATGKSRQGMQILIATHALHRHFATQQTADTAPGKPGPAMIYRAAAEVGALPSRVLMIGDSIYDIQMARAAGATALGVAWGYHAPQALMAQGARSILKTWDDLASFLNGAGQGTGGGDPAFFQDRTGRPKPSEGE